jgi:hypothetical protein
MAILGVLGLAGSAALQGTRGFLGFLTGAVASALSFWLLHRLTGNVEAAATGGRVSALRVALLSLRFLVVGAGVYAILKTYEVSPSAVAAGLCLTVAAVTLANLYDWFRT